ncbi:related to glutaminase A [Lecanosticta acicola]|uniref:Related to glutaminase A n=1 Tax=Lecanosticta acicola TaxID=111012 RepID=A0AAI9E8U9_9PEZI|nr:related to glutaminase A [Lecanosticta acicola]
MRVWRGWDFVVTLLLGSSSRKAVATSTALLPSYPLAVKSPYLSTWVPGDQLSDIATAGPQFWTDEELTWPILARVDGTTYALFGSPSGFTSDLQAAKTENVSYSSLHTYFKLSAKGVNFTLDFFSPVYPKAEDYALHSLPYSYLTVNATTTGSDIREVQVFSAIDYTWTAQDGAADLNFTTTGNTSFFWWHNPKEIPFTESSDQATWGSVLFGTGSTSDSYEISHDCNTPNSVYSSFLSTGTLSASNSSCSGTYLAALSTDFGRVTSNGSSITFAVGFERPQLVNYLNQTQTGFHRTKWPNIPEAISYFLSYYSQALSRSRTFDAMVRSNTESVSSEWGSQYADICEASVRQAFAPVELAVPADDLSAAPSAFLKEISSNGNMNTIDVIFQSWPIFINLNPEWFILQLKPLLEYMKSGRWPKAWVIHDMGLHYPNATGHDDGEAEQMPLFETSSMFILMYAYQKLSGNDSYTTKYSDLLPGWAQYLADNGLYPSKQLISVDAIAATPNQTALAMQSAMGLKAAALLTGNDSYSDIADDFAKTIYDDGLGLNDNKSHFTYNYGDNDNWNVIFASFSDVFLNLTTFPQNAWDLQARWYLSEIQEAGLAFAGPVSDRGVDWALTDWNIMTAAALGSEDLTREIVNTTHAFLTNGINEIPFGTKYYVSGSDAGVWIANKARSTVGTHFSIAALQQGLWTY